MSTVSLDHARKMDKQFRTMDILAMDTSAPIDERSLIAAASDPRAIPMHELKEIQRQNKQRDHEQVRSTWATRASNLHPLDTEATPHDSTKTPSTLSTQFMPTSTNHILQTYQSIFHDVKHFNSLPATTFLKKSQMCFLDGKRAYLSVGTFLLVCLLVVVLVLVCRRSKPK